MIIISSCKKEKSDPVVAIKSEIVGKWASTGFTDVYYDASGKEVNRNQTPDNGGTKLTFNSNGQVNVPSTPDKSSSYTLTNVNGKVVLEFGGGPSWETTINGDVMQWKTEKDIPGPNYTKYDQIIAFKRQ